MIVTTTCNGVGQSKENTEKNQCGVAQENVHFDVSGGINVCETCCQHSYEAFVGGKEGCEEKAKVCTKQTSFS